MGSGSSPNSCRHRSLTCEFPCASTTSLVPQQYGLAVVVAITLVDYSHIIASATPNYVATSATLYPISTTTRLQKVVSTSSADHVFARARCRPVIAWQQVDYIT